MRPLRRISVTAAARAFAEVVNRAFYRGETTILLRGGIPVACISPVAPTTRTAAELAAEWSSLPRLTTEDAESFAAELDEARRSLPPSIPAWE